MNRSFLIILLMLFIFISISYSNNLNIGLYPTYGGRIEYNGIRPLRHDVERLFDGDATTRVGLDLRPKGDQNEKPSVDRIWDSNVRINKVSFIARNEEESYEYEFYYWDLDNNEWKQLLYINENTEQRPEHLLDQPVITNKMRFKCLKAGATGEASVNTLFEIYYYGEFVEGPPF